MERGIGFPDALHQVRLTSLFTTHTPVAAGHDAFPPELMDRYFSSYYPALGLTRGQFLGLGTHPDYPENGFNMTVLAMRLSSYHNAVSQRHGEVTRQMWKSLWPDLPQDRVPIDAITNGVHLPTWLNPRIEDLLDTYFYPVTPNWQQEHDDPGIWNLVDEIPDGKLWDLHFDLKIKLHQPYAGTDTDQVGPEAGRPPLSRSRGTAPEPIHPDHRLRTPFCHLQAIRSHLL